MYRLSVTVIIVTINNNAELLDRVRYISFTISYRSRWMHVQMHLYTRIKQLYMLNKYSS